MSIRAAASKSNRARAGGRSCRRRSRRPCSRSCSSRASSSGLQSCPTVLPMGVMWVQPLNQQSDRLLAVPIIATYRAAVMPDPDLPAIVAIVEASLDELGEVCRPVEGGVALVTAGISEIGSGEDPREVLSAYRDLLASCMPPSPPAVSRRRHPALGGHPMPQPQVLRAGPRRRASRRAGSGAATSGSPALSASSPGPDHGNGLGVVRHDRRRGRSSPKSSRPPSGRRQGGRDAAAARRVREAGGAVPMSVDLIFDVHLVRPGQAALLDRRRRRRAARGRADRRGPVPTGRDLPAGADVAERPGAAPGRRLGGLAGGA